MYLYIGSMYVIQKYFLFFGCQNSIFIRYGTKLLFIYHDQLLQHLEPLQVKSQGVDVFEFNDQDLNCVHTTFAK